MSRQLQFVLIVATCGLGVCAPVSAGFWRAKGEPGAWHNYWGRKLGIGWSDGYHAYGSPNSWMPAAVPTRTHHGWRNEQVWRHAAGQRPTTTAAKNVPPASVSSPATVQTLPRRSSHIRRLPRVEVVR